MKELLQTSEHKLRVLVVDDSMVLRSQIKLALAAIPGVDVVGTVANGRLALQFLETHAIELITLDLNMPEMSGLELLQKIGRLGKRAPEVIVYANATSDLAQQTSDALSLGAREVIVKPASKSQEFERAYLQISAELTPHIEKIFAESLRRSKAKSPPAAADHAPRSVESFQPSVITIASSTGGPEALEVLFRALHGHLDIPVFIAQHMPPRFTHFLAQRLGSIGKITCREAVDGELVSPGIAYMAPGDFHMRLVKVERQVKIQLDQGEKVNGVRPAADLLLESVAQCYERAVAGFVLSGMGTDGRFGSHRIRDAGGVVVIQNKETSVVWGMPGAVHASKAYDCVATIDDCARIFSRMCRHN